MIAAPGNWLEPTRAIGMGAFGCAVVASGVAWVRLARRPGIRRLPVILTVIHCFLLLDMVFNLRWRLHDAMQHAAMSAGVYQLRTLPQVFVLLALGLTSMVVCLVLLRRQWRRKGALLAILGTWLAIASWCMEVVSLHAVDAVLYVPKEPFMPVALIWILVAGMTTLGISRYAGATGSE